MSNLAYQQVQPNRKYQQEPKQRPQLKVKKKRNLTIGEKFLITLLIVFSTIGCVVIVANQAKIFQVNNDVRLLESKIESQMKVNSGLEEEITQLERPERILQIAAEQGLTIHNNNVQVIGN
ncbi:cell division protein FtsL [Bacillus sp. Marseille-P3661]|uniref:cell division protein FtsL n=1 Tax=Bacillus sp. Marseille-P3661 TaxID=1936234 RepID=UPI000C8596B4|nr:cell division protein FtsL [Bacillus sp. Marseille-P3661]